jgi:hypothetical protein
MDVRPRNGKGLMPKLRGLPQEDKPEPQPLDPVKVRNLGTAHWVGSDFAPVGRGAIEAGDVGVVTFRKFQQLQEHFPASIRGVGPFELVEG